MRDHVLRRAQDYLEQGRVETIWVDGDALRAHVSGTSSTPYHCVVRLHEGLLEPQCSCPYTRGPCWHVGSVLLALIADDGDLIGQLESQAARADDGSTPPPAAPSAEPDPEAGVSAPEPRSSAAESEEELRDKLLIWPKSELVDLIASLAMADARLHAKLIAQTPETTDLDLRLFRQAARAALRSGRPLDRYQIPRVAEDLEEIVASVGRLVGGGHPEQALQLMSEIATMAAARREEVEDLDGVLSAFVASVLRSWCRGWAEISGRDRQKLARQIFGWLIEDHGGVTKGLVLDAREALGRAGIDALEALLKPLVKTRTEQVPGMRKRDDGALDDPLLRRARRALRETAELRGQLDDFLAHCDSTGRDSEDVIAAARRLAQAGDHERALSWTDKGRDFARGSALRQLDDLRVDLLLRVGRRREAIDTAWQMFRSAPGRTSYRRLLEIVNESERGEWRRRALDHADGSCDSTDFVHVCVAANDAERIAHRYGSSPEFVSAAHASALESAIDALEGDHADVSAELCGQLASRLLSQGDSARYADAQALLTRAHRAWTELGNNLRFQDMLKELTQRHNVVGTWFDEAWFRERAE